MKNAIIVIGYNNVKALSRLLLSLNRAEYEGDRIPLIISIDKSENTDVLKTAKEFQWQHGKKEIRTFQERQGLQKHVMSCGEYLQKYDALFVFEDDTFAAQSYYQFGKNCIEFYKENERVAGIALYSPAWNQNANFPFEPVKSKYDTYFMQYAPSLGQIWFKNPWFDFMAWYEEHKDLFDRERNPDIPAILYTWGKHSWLKYHIAYCAMKKKYFVFPYCSYTTDFVETGTHFTKNITRFQVNLIQGRIETFHLAPFSENAVRYDAFLENEQLKDFYRKKGMQVKTDLYGCQNIAGKDRFVLTTQSLPFEVVDKMSLQLRPHELNVFMEMEGNGIYLYDTSKKVKKAPEKRNDFYLKRWDYYMKDRFLMLNEILPVCLNKAGSLLGSFKKKR